MLHNNTRTEQGGKKVVSEQLLESAAKQQVLVEKFKGQLKLVTQQDYACIDEAEKAIVEFLNHKTASTQTVIDEDRIIAQNEDEESDQPTARSMKPKDLDDRERGQIPIKSVVN